MDSLSQLPIYGWAFLTIITGVVGFILYKIVRVNGLAIKAGDKEINLSSRNASIVKVVTEYADFKYKLNDELTEAKKDLHDNKPFLFRALGIPIAFRSERIPPQASYRYPVLIPGSGSAGLFRR